MNETNRFVGFHLEGIEFQILLPNSSDIMIYEGFESDRHLLVSTVLFDYYAETRH